MVRKKVIPNIVSTPADWASTSSVLHKCQSQTGSWGTWMLRKGFQPNIKARSIQQKARLPNDWTQGKEMTPDGCRGSFHVLGSAAAWDTGSGSGNKKEAGKIRPNTVIIPHSFFQVNGEMASRRQNLCPAQKQTSSFGEHSVLKSSKIHDIL